MATCQIQLNRVRSRRGMSVLEVSVAAAMLCGLMLIAVQMFRAVMTQQQSAERHALALETAQALAEQIGNMKFDEVTVEAVREIVVPTSAAAHLPSATLAVTMNEEDDPVAAKRVTIELSWNNARGRPARPVRVTCWVFNDER
jgi:hypothetical protein